MSGRLVCYGEMLVRLSPPPGETLAQARGLSVHVGGAEANVAVCVARLGGDAAMATTLPDNPLGHGARDALRAAGVAVDCVSFVSETRMGLYFLTPGASVRAPDVLYDRAGSAFAEAPAPMPAARLLEGATRLHMSGITPAVSARAADAALALARTAIEQGVAFSFDGNYRAKLWAAWRGEGPATIRALLQLASVAFIDERDIALALGCAFAEEDAAARRRSAFAAAFEAFPHLQVIAHAARRVHDVARHDLTGVLALRGGAVHEAEPVSVQQIVDRVGGGDAFAGAFLYALQSGQSPEEALPFAVMCSAAKHAQIGDMSVVSAAEVRALMDGGSLDVRR
ncbi:MAG: sugar kinase [Hyphomonadaceae bacterium]|nr:sugar kinase [Hyphomonadaceae bacterium]